MGMSQSNETRMAVMRSPLSRARGLGAARSGVGHWWAQRLSAVALLPLVLWFVASILMLAGAGQPAVAHWAAQPVHAVLLLCLILASFYHMQLGLQVVIEDYIHADGAKLAALLAMKAACVLLALTALLAALRLAL
jgi:succinate dehydrogenase / fumarate reductase membrane anchor subunit